MTDDPKITAEDAVLALAEATFMVLSAVLPRLSFPVQQGDIEGMRAMQSVQARIQQGMDYMGGLLLALGSSTVERTPTPEHKSGLILPS